MIWPYVWVVGIIAMSMCVKRRLDGKYPDPPVTVEVGDLKITAANYLGVEEILTAATNYAIEKSKTGQAENRNEAKP